MLHIMGLNHSWLSCMLTVVASQACYMLITMMHMFCLLQGPLGHTKARQHRQHRCKMFLVLESCTEAWTDLGDDSANVDLSCQAYYGHPDALLLGDLDGILDVAWITGGQASKKHQDLHSSIFLYTHFCKQSCRDNMLTVGLDRLLGGGSQAINGV